MNQPPSPHTTYTPQPAQPPATLSKMELLARDIALLTSDQLYTPEEIAQAYGLTTEHYAALSQDAAFKERVAYHTAQIGQDDNGLLRARARLMSSSLLRSLFEIAQDSKSKASDRLKAMSTVFELADVKPKQEQQFSGMVLNVSFGSGTPTTTIVAPPTPPEQNTPQSAPVAEITSHDD